MRTQAEIDAAMVRTVSPSTKGHTEYRYWARRRTTTASRIRWADMRGAFEALDDAAYCLDRPDSLEN